MNNTLKTELVIDGQSTITIEDVYELSRCEINLKLDNDPIFIHRINQGPEVVQELIKNETRVYGLNTGLGASNNVTIPKELIPKLSGNILLYLGAGLGDYFNKEQTRAILMARLVSLSRGYSGVSLELLEQLVSLIKWDILPRIPQEGSVGASGDLVPLSYVGAVLCGDRDVIFQNKILTAAKAFEIVGMTPLKLKPKEGLALVNGTSVMTGIACLAWIRAERLCQLTTRLTSLAIVGANGNFFHYDEKLFSLKPHVGPQKVASRIRQDLLVPNSIDNYPEMNKVQDRYSLRCAPQVIGILEDTLPFFRQLIQDELNSANDNPLIDIDNKCAYNGSMFYGGHMCFAMDGIKTLVASIADLMDRQLALLVDPLYNRGLPGNLSGVKGACTVINHGLKGLQIAASSWTAEALKLTLPASSFSRSTECHNQDKVSMGTIGARDCMRIIELTEQVGAALMIGVRQALHMRREIESKNESIQLSKQAQDFVNMLNHDINFIEEDIVLDSVLKNLVNKIQDGVFTIY